jgi:hypothetical protein
MSSIDAYLVTATSTMSLALRPDFSAADATRARTSS